MPPCPPVVLDIAEYDRNGTIPIGTYGKSTFYSDYWCRAINEHFHKDGCNGKFLDDRYYVVHVTNGVEWRYVLYDYRDRTLVFDSASIEEMELKISMFLAMDDSNDIVVMAKNMNHRNNGKSSFHGWCEHDDE